MAVVKGRQQQLWVISALITERVTNSLQLMCNPSLEYLIWLVGLDMDLIFSLRRLIARVFSPST